jgi:hypothetical protein
VTGELVLRPVEHPSDASVWRAGDGTTYDTDTLAARCLAMLAEQMAADPAAGPAK